MTKPPIELLAKDLNDAGAIYCPSPLAHMTIQDTHPKVYLNVSDSGAAKCPYCGRVYKLKDGEHFQSH